MAGNDSNTRLLLHCDALAGTSDVIDAGLGSAAKSLTVGALHSTTQAKFDYASLRCNGTGVIVGPSTDWNFGTSQFTIDLWAYIVDGNLPYIAAWWANDENHLAIERVNGMGSTVGFGIVYRLANVIYGQSGTPAPATVVNGWHHFALSRDGLDLRLFIDGVVHASVTLPAWATSIDLTLMPLYIAGGVERGNFGIRHMDGYVDEVRVQNGFAWTAGFTPRTQAYVGTVRNRGIGNGSVGSSYRNRGIGVTACIQERLRSRATGTFESINQLRNRAIGQTIVQMTSRNRATGTQEVIIGRCRSRAVGRVDVINSCRSRALGKHTIVGTACRNRALGLSRREQAFINRATNTFELRQSLRNRAIGTTTVEVTAGARYEIYHAIGALPDFDAAPAATSATLPINFPMTGVGLHYLVLRYRNQFGLISQNRTPTIIELDGSDNAIVVRPSAPHQFAVVPRPAAAVAVSASYLYTDDGTAQADKWLIFVTTNGVNPNPGVDTPTVVDMTKLNGVAYLEWDSPSYSAGQTIKVLVQTRRTTPARDSSNTTPVSTVAVTAGLAAPTIEAYHSVSGCMTGVS